MCVGKRLVCGYEDGTIKIWDLKSGSAIHTITGRFFNFVISFLVLKMCFLSYAGHQGSITSLSCHPDNVVIMTGSVDVTSRLINSQTGKVLIVYHCIIDSV
jgi:WD40 repeat protein